MPCSQDLELRPPSPPIPPKGDSSPASVRREVPLGGALLFAFVDDCAICRKESAVVGGLCIGCDHLMGDVQIDQINQGR